MTRTSWGLDPRARTLEVAIDLPNPDRKLRTEMYVVAAIAVTNPRVLMLPAPAIAGQGDDAYAVQVVDGKAARTPIRVGNTIDGMVEVLKKQSAPGVWEDVTEADQFVAVNVAELAEGTKVVVEGK